jgi:histidinol-phosphatase (PHP family)
MKTNYHTHCDFCDGIADPETVVKTAIEKGIDVLGFREDQRASEKI